MVYRSGHIGFGVTFRWRSGNGMGALYDVGRFNSDFMRQVLSWLPEWRLELNILWDRVACSPVTCRRYISPLNKNHKCPPSLWTIWCPVRVFLKMGSVSSWIKDFFSIQVLIQLHETKYLSMISSSIHHHFEGEIEFHMWTTYLSTVSRLDRLPVGLNTKSIESLKSCQLVELEAKMRNEQAVCSK